ncbi:DUF6248 family natural product biosynthesis protein [Streptomyces sp. NPDC088360]|uniref:DUF6248 family natural product biosynthesis protein n=1 Tax=Streptomyces sp. NPDC088360 TaxID=3154515 RepID=UPI00344B4071
MRNRQEGGPRVDGGFDWVHGARGRVVAKLILRPDDAPCVWWCRCPCAKDGPAPDGPAQLRRRAKQAATAEADGGVRPDRAAASRQGRRAPESADEAQYTLF